MNNLKLIRSTRGIVVLLVLSFLISYNSASAVLNGYLGAGFFPVNNLNWCHFGAGFAVESQNAIARWSVDTDVNMITNCTGTHITTKFAAYGNIGWAGKGFICSNNGICDAPGAWGAMYVSCEARLNSTVINANPQFYTSAEVQKLAMHEIGHCYSLDHANAPSALGGGAVPSLQDKNLVNARY